MTDAEVEEMMKLVRRLPADTATALLDVVRTFVEASADSGIPPDVSVEAILCT